MATGFPLPVTAAQVGTYFVGQYYQMLQNQPDFVHQFYSESSTMLRIDGNTRDAATAMLQIHQLIMSLNYSAIEIKTAHSLESWNGGVLVMVSGSAHLKDFNGRKKFVETFLLAPQEKGYFVFNDIFHYVDEEQVLQLPISYLPQSNLLDSKLHSSVTREQVHSQPPFNKPAPPEWQSTPENPSQPSVESSNPIERSGIDFLEETSAMEDEVEVKSVYVRNVPTTMAASEIGEEFKKFGKLKPDGVAIRTRKDIDVCYAFVEFEDISGVRNAIKASMVQIGSHQLYIEGRRPNRNNFIRGRGRGRGRISYPMEGMRGRFVGHGLSRSSNQDGFENYYNRPRGNGFYRQQPLRHQRAYSNHQGSRNRHHSSD